MTYSNERAESIDLMVVLNSLRRHKRLILATMVVVNMTAAVGVLLYGPHYTATGSVLIEHRDNRVLGGKTITNALPEWLPGDNSVMSTQVSTLKSPSLAGAVVAKLGLADDPEFSPSRTKIAERLRAFLRQWVPAEWAAQWPSILTVTARHADEATVLKEVQHRLSVDQEGSSHVILVSFTSSDAQKSASIVNAVLRQYLDEELAIKKSAVDRAYSWAVDNVEQIGAELRKAENDATEYMARTGLVAANASERADGGLAAQQLTNLQRDLATARAALAASKAKTNQVHELQVHGGSYASLAEVANSPIILELKKQDVELLRQQARLSSSYGAQNAVLEQITAQRAGIAAGIKQEIDRIVRNLGNELVVAQGRVDALEAMIAAVDKQYAEAERESVQLRELNRIASAKRALYESLLTRLSDIGEQRALLEPDARLLSSAAVPAQPSSPKFGLIGASAFLGSCILGISLAAINERSDRRIRMPWQIARELGVPMLAMVPGVRRLKRDGKPLPYLLAEPQSIYAEATRSILTGIQLSQLGHSAARVILVTSALPGEGKTTLAMSLAALAARRGHRTVIMDLDIHHPSLAGQLDSSITAGLPEYVSGRVTVDEIIRPHPSEPRLHIIAAKRDRSFPDLLASARLRTLIEELRLRYEWVVLDSPPTIAVSDVQTVGPMADAAVFVVRWGRTSQSAAARGLDVLGKTGIEVVGAVLSQVDLGNPALYGADSEFYRKHQEYFHG